MVKEIMSNDVTTMLTTRVGMIIWLIILEPRRLMVRKTVIWTMMAAIVITDAALRKVHSCHP